MFGSSRKPLDPDAAEEQALEFAAGAAHRELVLHAEYSGDADMVKLADRSLHDAMPAVVQAERRVAVELLRFSWGVYAWESMKPALQMYDICRADLERAHPGALNAAF